MDRAEIVQRAALRRGIALYEENLKSTLVVTEGFIPMAEPLFDNAKVAPGMSPAGKIIVLQG